MITFHYLYSTSCRTLPKLEIHLFSKALIVQVNNYFHHTSWNCLQFIESSLRNAIIVITSSLLYLVILVPLRVQLYLQVGNQEKVKVIPEDDQRQQKLQVRRLLQKVWILRKIFILYFQVNVVCVLSEMGKYFEEITLLRL